MFKKYEIINVAERALDTYTSGMNTQELKAYQSYYNDLKHSNVPKINSVYKFYIHIVKSRDDIDVGNIAEDNLELAIMYDLIGDKVNANKYNQISLEA